MMNRISGGDVLALLIPNGGWTIAGDDYEGITFIECDSITKEQFDNAFANYESLKAEQDAAIAAKKATAETKLAALGLTPDDLKALGL